MSAIQLKKEEERGGKDDAVPLLIDGSTISEPLGASLEEQIWW